MQDLPEDKIEEMVQGFYIPPKPEVLSEIHREQAKEEPDISAIASAIAKDVGLAASVLKTINSPSFAVGQTISDIKQSVMLLGLQNVIHLVTFYELKRATSGEAAITLERFWDTSVEIAQMTLPTLSSLNLKNKIAAEDAYAMGLFHDCGIALMAMRYDNYKSVLQEANSSPQGFVAAEERYYDTNHAIVGYYVAKSWNLPETICQLILRHHDHDFIRDAKVEEVQKDLMCTLWLATNCQHKYSRLDEHIEWHFFKEDVMFHFGLSTQEHESIETDIVTDFGELN